MLYYYNKNLILDNYKITDKYILDDNKIFFEDDFNENLEPYINLIANCFQLIFCSHPIINNRNVNPNKYANHEDLFFCEHNDHSQFNFDITYLPNSLELIVLSDKFNSFINLDNSSKLEKLTFGYNFNKSIKLLNLVNLTHLSFGNHFTYPLEISHLDKLTHLKLSEKYNQKFDFPPNLYYLYLGYYFSLNINLPSTIKIIHVNMNNQWFVDNLPNSIEELFLDGDIDDDLTLDNLPNQIKRLKFSEVALFPTNSKLNNLPDSIELIEFSEFTESIKIKPIPKNLKKIKCNIKCVLEKEIISKCEIEYYE
jgi:hypothetical protein